MEDVPVMHGDGLEIGKLTLRCRQTFSVGRQKHAMPQIHLLPQGASVQAASIREARPAGPAMQGCALQRQQLC